MSIVNPTAFTETNVVAGQALARGSTVRGTIDLTNKFGMFLLARIGRADTTALGTIGVYVGVRRIIGGASGIRIHPAAGQSRLGTIAAAGASSAVSVDAAIGAVSFTVTSGTGFVAGDLIKIQDSGGGVTRLEWARVSKVATNVLTVDAPLQFAHTAAQADTVTSGSDVFAPIWCPGGSLWEVVFDYGASTAGSTVAVEAVAQAYVSDTIT